MVSHKGTDRDQVLERELAEMRTEYDTLKDEKVRAEQNLENIRRQLSELQAEAEQEYGTADPEKLEKLLEEKRAENERLVAGYREHLDSVKASLEKMEAPGGEEE